MLKSADLHETVLTPVICHKHVCYHDAVFLREVSIGRSKEDEKWIFFLYLSKTKQQKKAFWSKNNQKKEENLDWTLVNIEKRSSHFFFPARLFNKTKAPTMDRVRGNINGFSFATSPCPCIGLIIR